MEDEFELQNQNQKDPVQPSNEKITTTSNMIPTVFTDRHSLTESVKTEENQISQPISPEPPNIPVSKQENNAVPTKPKTIEETFENLGISVPKETVENTPLPMSKCTTSDSLPNLEETSAWEIEQDYQNYLQNLQNQADQIEHDHDEVMDALNLEMEVMNELQQIALDNNLNAQNAGYSSEDFARELQAALAGANIDPVELQTAGLTSNANPQPNQNLAPTNESIFNPNNYTNMPRSHSRSTENTNGNENFQSAFNSEDSDNSLYDGNSENNSSILEERTQSTINVNDSITNRPGPSRQTEIGSTRTQTTFDSTRVNYRSDNTYRGQLNPPVWTPVNNTNHVVASNTNTVQNENNSLNELRNSNAQRRQDLQDRIDAFRARTNNLASVRPRTGINANNIKIPANLNLSQYSSLSMEERMEIIRQIEEENKDMKAQLEDKMCWICLSNSLYSELDNTDVIISRGRNKDRTYKVWITPCKCKVGV